LSNCGDSSAKHGIAKLADRSQWMILWHSLLGREVAEHSRLLKIVSAHSVPPALVLDQIIFDPDQRAEKKLVFLGKQLINQNTAPL